MSRTTFDPFRPVDPRDVATKFPDTIVERARKRLPDVAATGTDQWQVAGNPSMGDHYPHYDVTLIDGRYWCSCTGHVGGEYRAAKKCSHAIACMLWRQDERERRGQAETTPPTEAGDTAVSPTSLSAPEPLTGGEGDGGEADPSPPVGADVEGASSGRHGDSGEVVPTQPAPSTPTTFVLDPRDPHLFRRPGLPEWVTTFRPTQVDALAEIAAGYDHSNVVIAEAPTGSGKSLMGEATRQLLDQRGIYLCSTKQLQDQAARDFPYAVVLKGRANYPTLDYPERFGWTGPDQLTCADCTRQPGEDWCAWCSEIHACPYNVVRESANNADLVIGNYAYFLAEANYVGRLRFPFAIADEADLLEEEVMRFVEVTITERTRHKLGIGEPAKKTVESAWVDYLRDEVLPAVTAAYQAIPADTTNVTKIRERKRWKQMARKVADVLAGMEEGGWVYTGYDKGIVQFKPVRVARYGTKYLWRHVPRWLLMSATVISADQMADDLGLTDDA